jgi:WD40 repeat protein
VLTVAGYHESGGIRGAVAHTAEEVYGAASEAEQAVIRELMLRLVTASDAGEPVPTRVTRSLFAGDPGRAAVLERLVAARLVTSGNRGVELAHESLARAWPRLAAGLGDDLDGRRIRQHLTAAADAWDAMDRPDGELYRAKRLDEANEWRADHHPELSPIEAIFLDASASHATAERRAAEDRSRRQARSNRRLRVLLSCVGALLVAVLIAGGAAVREAGRADTAAQRAVVEADRAADEAARADSEADNAREEAARADAEAAIARQEAARADRVAATADARRVGALALASPEVDRALLLAVEGVRLEDSPEARANLLAVMQRNPALLAARRTGQSAPVTIDISPDGSLAAVGTFWGELTLYDVDTWEAVSSFDAVPPRSVAFTPDGGRLVVARASIGLGEPEPAWDPRPLRILDVPSATPAPEQPGGVPAGALWPSSTAFSADGRWLVAAFEGAFGVWDMNALATPVLWRTWPTGTPGVALSPDGQRVYVGSNAPPSITAVSVASGEVMATAALPGGTLRLSPDGGLLASVSGPDVVLIDTATLTEVRRLRGHRDDVADVRFSPDGDALASASADTTAALWDVATGMRRDVFEGHHGAVVGLAFSPDDRRLTTVGDDHLILTWDLVGSSAFRELRRTDVRAPVRDLFGWVLPAPNGAYVLYADFLAGTMRILDVASGRTTEPIPSGHGAWGAVAWRPDSERFVTVGGDGWVRVWDPATGALVAERQVAEGHLAAVTYTTAGASTLMIAERRGVVSTINAETLEPIGPQVAVGGQPVFAFANPIEPTAIVFTFELEVIVVDLAAGTILDRQDLRHGANYGAFSPNGQLFASTSLFGRVHLLDAGTGQLIAEHDGHTGEVLYADYSPDGSTFLTSGRDGRVNLWDGRTGSLLSSVRPADADEHVSAVYSTSGDTVVIATGDGELYEWDLDIARWIAAACAIAGRDLDEREWRDTFGDHPYHETCAGRQPGHRQRAHGARAR